ncbi:MAG: NAD(P)/FAD-dependent oxidoreductase, partial [Gemmataceae bacterium]
MTGTADVAIVGGGIIGLMTAALLAESGQRVHLYDVSDLGREASWAGAGIVPPGNREAAPSPVDWLRADSAQEYPRLAAQLAVETGIDVGYRRCGGLEFLPPDDEVSLARWQSAGLRTEPLSDAEVRQLEPELEAKGFRVVRLPEMAQVRNPHLLRALQAVCQSRGVGLYPRTPVRDWSAPHLTLGDNTTRKYTHCLIAIGAWAGAVAEQWGLSVPIRPVRGQIQLLQPTHTLLRHVVLVGKRYIVPRDDGRILIGSTEEPDAQFDKTTTPQMQENLLNFARSIVPGWGTLFPIQSWAGLRPVSADTWPIISPVPAREGLWIVGGHGRAGIQLALGTARLVRNALKGQADPALLQAFRLDRDYTEK